MNPRMTLFLTVLVAGVTTASIEATSGLRPISAHRPADVSQMTPQPQSLWATQWGGFDFVRGLQAIGPESVWAVGSHAVHYDGQSWKAVDRRDHPAGLTGVSLLEDGMGWMVGNEEELIPIQGGTAGPSVHVPGYRFRDIATVSESEAWAVALTTSSRQAVILHFLDGRWTEAWTGDGSTHLSSIWMASATEGWAVGSTAVHFDGQGWTEWTLPPMEVSLNTVRGSGPGDVWAAGGRALGSQRVLLHFDGAGWKVVLNEDGPGIRALAIRATEGIAVSAAGDVFALREGKAQLLTVNLPSSWRPQFIEDFTSATYVPGAPYALVSTASGVIYRLQGQDISLVRDVGTFTGVAMANDHLGWAVGRRAVSFDGLDWSELPDASELHRAVDVAATSSGEAWAAGADGLLLRYRGGAWERVLVPTAADFKRVVTMQDGAVWVFGDAPVGAAETPQAVIIGPDGGGGWREVWRGPGKAGDVAATAGRALVTTSAGVWHLEGTAWSKVRDKGAVSVGIGPAGELWAGDNGMIQQLAPTGWTTVATMPANSESVNAFYTGDQAVWAVGDFGIVAAYRAGVWQVVRGDPELNGYSGAPYSLNDMATVSLPGGQTGLWAVGAPDTIIHSLEADVLGLPGITPQPTRIHFPFPTPVWGSVMYLPRLDLRPAYRGSACGSADGAPIGDIESVAWSTARFYSRGGPQPEPSLHEIGLLTAGDLAAEHGIDLVGVDVRGQAIRPESCLWWAHFAGWFDDASPGSTPSAPDPTWTRMDLVLSLADGAVIYEGFAGKATPAPPTQTRAPGRPTHEAPPTPTYQLPPTPKPAPTRR